jgi:general secretion pathway protein D
MLLTPRVVRNLARPDTVAAQFSSGTDASPGAPPLRLAATEPGALSIAPAAGAAAPKPMPPFLRGAPGAAPPASAESVELALAGPAQAAIGQEFVVTLSLPARNQGANATVELSYDPTVLNAVGGQPTAAPTPGAPPAPDPGRALVAVVGPAVAGAPPTATQARFRVVATAPTTTTIRLENLNATDAVGAPLAVNAPGPISITIVGAVGAK